jgi:PAS domain S-box-containing protein
MAENDHPTSSFLKSSQLRASSFADYAIYMLDPEGRIASWNQDARSFEGYEAEEIIGEHYARFFTREDRAAALPERALAIAAKEGRFATEGWRVRRDGTRFWAQIVIDPVRRPDDGELIGFIKIAHDISGKRAREKALYESELRFSLLVQGVRDYAIYMLDQQGYITNWNTGAEAIKGYRADEIIGEHFSRFYTDEDRARGEPARALETALREGKFENEAWRRRKDGTLFWANVVIDPIYDEAGAHIGFAKITRDITDRKKAQEELEEARVSLFQAQKLQALGELTGGIAHDFNNLMTVIRGSAELLRGKNLTSEKQERYLDAIMETVDRASNLTNHLLAFSRRQALRPEVIDVNVRLDAFGEVISRTLGSQVEVVLDLAPSVWKVEADPTQLETALLNAAINARDAMPDGGRLTLSTANHPDPSGDLVCISLTDTGTGMPADVAGRVFEPFFTTKPIGKGTGLGLSQVHGFAAQTGGRAEIKSVEGEGTTLRLLLPRCDREVCARRTADLSEPLPPGLSVLLVEDSQQVRSFAEQLLRDLQCKVLTASGGEEALAILEREAVDLVFSDVMMPGMTGVELARRIRAHFPELPVLLASGYSDEIIGGAAGEFDIVRKPYGASALNAGVRAILARRSNAS